MIFTVVLIFVCVISIGFNVFVFSANRALTSKAAKAEADKIIMKERLSAKGEINKELNEKMLAMRTAFNHNNQQIREQDQVILDLHNEIKELKKSK